MLINYELATPAQKTGADLGLLLARVPLGVLFLLAGINKFRGGIDEFVNANLDNAPLPHGLASAYLHALPFAEITVGACLIIGLLTGIFALLAFLMLLSFTIAATGWLQKGMPHPNVIYMGLAFALAAIGPGRISADLLIFGKRDKRIT